jgi:hypothetical protein
VLKSAHPEVGHRLGMALVLGLFWDENTGRVNEKETSGQCGYPILDSSLVNRKTGQPQD